MLFNSFGYLLLLLVAVPLHWLLPGRVRVYVLLAFSVLFYAMWRWDFALLVVFSACVDYVCARRIARSHSPRARRAFLLTSLVTNLGLLVFFKYAYFISDNIFAMGSAVGLDWADRGLAWNIVLPLGISFYTFQTISYTIDVYRGVSRPTRHFPTFLTYVMFWPQLIAGPILRAREVIPQIEGGRVLDWQKVNAGVLLILTGLTKKVVLADSIAGIVDGAFAVDAAAMTAFDAWAGTFLFGFQIYFDFAGYSDIAIGSALLLGFEFPKNFNWPYMATTPREFWSRWHISLSSWIRDYLYLPMTGQPFRTGSRDGLAVASEAKAHRLTFALFMTWFIMGLWHGAAWTFALWGLYHGALVYLYRAVGPLRELAERRPALGWLVMLPLAMAGWIPFRAASVGDALTLFGKLVNPFAYTMSNRAIDGEVYLAVLVLTLGMLGLYFARRLAELVESHPALGIPLTSLAVAAMTIVLLATMRPVKQFIYFQF